jgi:hypothetical protein
MNLASLRQFLIQLPLIPMPAMFINCGLGNGGSFVLGQGQAQPTDYFPCPDTDPF